MTTQLLESTGQSADADVSRSPWQVEFDLEPNDLLNFINYHYVDSRNVRRQRLLLGALGFGTLAAFPVMVALASDKPTADLLRSLWPLFLSPFAFLFCFPLFYRWGLRRTCRRLLNEGDERGYFGPRIMSLEPFGVREVTVRGETIRSWPAVRKIVRVRQYGLIYTSTTEAFVLPERAFPDDEACQAFLKQAAERARVQLETA